MNPNERSDSLKFSVLSSTQDIPPDTAIAIYGTGDTAQKFLAFWRLHRPDSQVAFFIDSFKKGSLAGIEIKIASDCRDVQIPIIICSVFWNQIVKNFSPEHLYILGNRFLHDTTHLKKWGDFHLSPTEFQQYRKDFEFISSRFFPDDLKLYNTIWGMRSGECQERTVYNELLNSCRPLEEQYLDKISDKRIETILEAGVFDGASTLGFYKRFKSEKLKVYGFDPYEEIYRNSKYRNELENRGFYFDQRALWSTSGRLVMDGIQIDSISVDDFIKNQNLNIDLLKMDVEGHELQILQGASHTITSQKPIIALSIYHRAKDFIDLPKYLLSLRPDYKFMVGNYTCSFVDTVLYAV